MIYSPKVFYLDAFRSAYLLVKNLGDGALEHATQRQLELERLPDLAGAAVWAQISIAIQVLSRTKRSDGEMLQ